ncbi:MAG: phosphoenolpyruvate--protein phosphotransferase [Gammaproteobacteria bacterium]|nr:MAG: phosphoenolpyruvate--protein phosphotransferase [Gammaproteobacteria bacterium]
MSLMFNGIGVARGIAIGDAWLLRRYPFDNPTERDIDTPAREIRRLKAGIRDARHALEQTREEIPEDASSDVSAFIETHLLMLDDSLFLQRPSELIREQRISAEAALQLQREELTRVFGAMEDSYIATRIDDVNHVVNSILRALHVAEHGDTDVDHTAWKGRIIIADDLTPADTVIMKKHGVAAFATETGGQTSHTAVLARSLDIPAIVGLHNLRRYIRHGETLALDGSSGMLLAEPTKAMLAGYRRAQREQRARRKALATLTDQPAVTLDGVEIELAANIEVDEDIKALRRVNADGVGLYRTEFLFMNRNDLPHEQEHFRDYSRVIRALKGKPLTIRSADLGADKLAASIEPLSGASTTNTHNPALGLRGIRLCLQETALFVPQLRAILRTSAKGPVRLLIPMLSGLEEINQTLALIDAVREELREEGIAFDEDMPIGGMIELPASAIMAEAFAERLDFLSIGTNDLIQYTLAIDRVDDAVNYLYDPLHPAVLKLVRDTIRAADKAGIPVSLCGEMAGDTRYVRLLLGLGLTRFSMPPNLLLEVKRCVLESRCSALRKQAAMLMKARSSEQRLSLLARMNSDA